MVELLLKAAKDLRNDAVTMEIIAGFKINLNDLVV